MSTHRNLIRLRVTESGYEPMDEAGEKQHAKMKVGDVVGAEIARSRSVVQNSYYWAVLAKVVTHAPGEWRTPEALHEVLKVATGHVEIVKLIGGRLIKIPQSTSFDRMPHETFQQYLDAAFKVIGDEILGGMGVDEFMANADGYNPNDQLRDAVTSAVGREE